MYRDNTLMPTEAVRLAALGALAASEMRYAELAADVRHFTERIVGPALDLSGMPVELMIVEGLIEPVDGAGMQDNARLRLTDAGWEAIRRLLTSAVRAPINDINKLIIALKMRFLHLLTPEERRAQVDMLVAMLERELDRLTDLRATYAGEPGYFLDWLDQDIAAARERLAWFTDLRDRLCRHAS
ncbi:Putative AphA-like transcriptional regulator [Limimonas halophila]|uniref:Putative AphA-like transcriptional regulator n=1 Tax=Limimonas halophila TaxID=1082479 RepID=A0A1G7T190_9PROT|nr:hypothetical protein [Limimonas halophila]SDG28978.1 Putative AphA-like transcriptional regulator [Limimonas halophila]